MCNLMAVNTEGQEVGVVMVPRVTINMVNLQIISDSANSALALQRLPS
jgi:hypothetical protein